MDQLKCARCGATVRVWENPAPTVDMIVHDPARGVVLIKRANPPYGYALPGGFVEVGETVEAAARREALEETGLSVTLTGLLGVYSDPARDARRHTISTVFICATAHPEALRAGDDAAAAGWWPLDRLPALAFDHARILRHFAKTLCGGRLAASVGDGEDR